MGTFDLERRSDFFCRKLEKVEHRKPKMVKHFCELEEGFISHQKGRFENTLNSLRTQTNVLETVLSILTCKAPNTTIDGFAKTVDPDETAHN